MSFSVKKRYFDAGRYGKRGIIYIVISIAGAIIEIIRFDFQRPFALVMWAIIFLIGLMIFLFMTDARRT
ncbi:hypothetical protein JXO59_07805 [candidate division KSB1 bacterium]|nr:hypothetical protein [candidate division KSB1 bacterium]